VSLVVLLRGINVGGHRRFRPAALAEELHHLDAVNIGAAGTLVVRKRISPTRLRAEIARRVPFEAAIVICDGEELAALLELRALAREPKAGIVRFVGVLASSAQRAPRLPLRLPPRGRWLVEVVAGKGRFVVGRYRREMRAIGHLGRLDELFGVPVTARNWSTLAAIASAVSGARPDAAAPVRRTRRSPH
jgi:uncharacterized protein (DUF1697 family)